ncbi:MAG: hypothetical protein KDB03_24140 [Planctomycetales bacterium]|nr:hypothetical protein [Planctomycetales bacterium]
MAKPLQFQLGELTLSFDLDKIHRTRLYGSKELEVLDDQQTPCELATLADDGRTIVSRGGTGMGWIDADGFWQEKQDLIPVDVTGEQLRPVASSFAKPITLFETATVDQYLLHNIRLVYALRPTNESGFDDLKSELERGTIFTFPYSYRGGLEADTAFLLLSAEGELILAVGTLTTVGFIGIQSPISDDIHSEFDIEEDELMSFDMI